MYVGRSTNVTSTKDLSARWQAEQHVTQERDLGMECRHTILGRGRRRYLVTGWVWSLGWLLLLLLLWGEGERQGGNRRLEEGEDEPGVVLARDGEHTQRVLRVQGLDGHLGRREDSNGHYLTLTGHAARLGGGGRQGWEIER